uniref:Uncharacterized protein n=1 Tax=Anguilla anguilla TaxID=7936 RepID=A0A0E9Q3K3_ANGAN
MWSEFHLSHNNRLTQSASTNNKQIIVHLNIHSQGWRKDVNL